MEMVENVTYVKEADATRVGRQAFLIGFIIGVIIGAGIYHLFI